MSFIEGIGDDLLNLIGCLSFLGLVFLAWLSTNVNQILIPRTFFHSEQQQQQQQVYRRNEDEESNRPVTPASPDPNSPSSANETATEQESDLELNDIEESIIEATGISIDAQHYQRPRLPCHPVNPLESASSATSILEEDRSLSVILKFLNETQKPIVANSNDTISRLKRLHFSEELANNKIIRFIHQGRELQDSETLRNYQIRDQTVIHCHISTPRHPSPNRFDDSTAHSHFNANGIDTSPIRMSQHFFLCVAFVLALTWYLRVHYRVLFTPISTILLILVTMIFLIFTCAPLFRPAQSSPNRRVSTHVQHVHQH